MLHSNSLSIWKRKQTDDAALEGDSVKAFYGVLYMGRYHACSSYVGPVEKFQNHSTKRKDKDWSTTE